VRPGSTADVPSGFEDHMPTICEAAGTQVPKGVDGTSLLPTLLGQQQPERSTPLYRELASRQAVRVGRWKGVRTGLKRGDTSMMVFDLEADPGETTDLASARPDIVAMLEGHMASQHEPSAVFPLPTIDAPASAP
ncbi:MAG: hypothetical protein QF733_10310, partial [Phycisphaerales bacterium]|nr:hypothetical protein [Phycisphaerales bacterium]